jgi:hypothetical protein
VVKSLFAVAAILVLTACPPDVYAPSIPGGGTGTLAFTLGRFCPTAYTVVFTVDNVDVGTETLVPDQQSTLYPMGTGVHTTRARTAAGTTKSWPNANIVVVAEETVNRTLDC